MGLTILKTAFVAPKMPGKLHCSSKSPPYNSQLGCRASLWSWGRVVRSWTVLVVESGAYVWEKISQITSRFQRSGILKDQSFVQGLGVARHIRRSLLQLLSTSIRTPFSAEASFSTEAKDPAIAAPRHFYPSADPAV